MSRYIIDKEKLEQNIEAIKTKAGVPVIAVVKGNGYGYGIKEFSSLLLEHKIETFAITEVSDLAQLREVVGDKDILMLRSTCVEAEAKEILKHNAIATIGSLRAAEVMNATAKEQGKIARCNLKIDVGMGRYGFLPGQVEDAIRCYEFEALEFVGAYTHFPCAVISDQLTRAQLEIFRDTMEQIKKAVGDVGVIHASNSTALLNIDDVSLDSVRVGSGFTGRVLTSKAKDLYRIGMLEAEVIETKIVPAGYSIGYNAEYTTNKETKLAIVPIGHYDGFGLTIQKEEYTPRFLLSVLKRVMKKQRMYVEINNSFYPVVGQIGLNHCTVDVTGSSVEPGDIARVDISPLLVNPRIERIYK